MIRVMVVEDSRVHQELLRAVISGEDQLELMAMVQTGEQALELAATERPDLVVMDIHLPGIGGLEAIQALMSQAPCPIVVFSSVVGTGRSELALDALRRGAVHVEPKPRISAPAEVDRACARLGRMLVLMSRVRVVRRLPKKPTPRPFPKDVNPGMVLIGGSTGAPRLLFEILDQLPRPYPVPVLISQHITPGFERSLCRWLGTTGHTLRLAQTGDRAEPGCVYVSPADGHLMVGDDQQLMVSRHGAPQPWPNIDLLFRSAAAAVGADALSVLLTGMGHDGTAGMVALRQSGATTIAQDPSCAAIESMPRSAIEAGGAGFVLDVRGIVTVLRSAAKRG